MKRTARDDRPYVPTLQKIEVSQKNIKLKCAAAILFFVVGAATLAIAMNASLTQASGWQEIKSDSSYADSCADRFVLMYHLGDSGTSPTKESKALKEVYADALQEAYRLFCSTERFEGTDNLFNVNAHPNETVTVASELYQALERIADSGNRQLFLAPAAVAYKQIFLCERDEEAAVYDPRLNPDMGAWVGELASYAGKPAHVSLEVLGDNCVRLAVSQEYLKFAEENEITVFVDFGWMSSAFAADFLADALIKAGFTKGYLTSLDGFIRNLDESGAEYTLNLLDRQENEILHPARMRYHAPASIVSLRDFPITDRDRWNYYRYENGDIVSVFLDPQDGMSKSAVTSLVAYSGNRSCAEILLDVMPAFIADQFHPEALAELSQLGVYSIWTEGNTICYNDKALNLELLPDSSPGYRAQYQ